MNVFISADIEGTCGIVADAEANPDMPRDYGTFSQRMTREAAAACRGALAAGASGILVRDAHGPARNIDPAGLPEGVNMLKGWTGDPLVMMSGIDEAPYDAAFFTGYHAWAGSGGNPLAHTINGQNEYILINGRQASEFLINAYTAAYYHVPVVMITGDDAICAYAREIVPAITTVAVHRTRGGGVFALHPADAEKQIQASAEAALGRREDCRLQLPERFDVSVRFRRQQVAYAKQFYPNARLTDSKTVSFSSDDWYEVLRFFHFVL